MPSKQMTRLYRSFIHHTDHLHRMLFQRDGRFNSCLYFPLVIVLFELAELAELAIHVDNA